LEINYGNYHSIIPLYFAKILLAARKVYEDIARKSNVSEGSLLIMAMIWI
jgi:hypothetical protein